MWPRLALNSLPLPPKIWDRTHHAQDSESAFYQPSYILRHLAVVVLWVFLYSPGWPCAEEPPASVWGAGMAGRPQCAWLRAPDFKCWGLGAGRTAHGVRELV